LSATSLVCLALLALRASFLNSVVALVIGLSVGLTLGYRSFRKSGLA